VSGLTKKNQTLWLSEVIERLIALKEENGDVPTFFMDPMNGNALNMDEESIEHKDGHVEIWPAD